MTHDEKISDNFHDLHLENDVKLDQQPLHEKKAHKVLYAN